MNKIWLQPILCVCVCVCGLCGTGISVSGASNISYILYNHVNVALDKNKHFTYLYWSGSLEKTPSAIVNTYYTIGWVTRKH